MNEKTSMGLSSEEAKRRLAQYGPNEVVEEKPKTWLLFLHKFWAPVPWMLEATFVLEVILGKWPEAIIIALLLLFNGILGFSQERKAKNALALLRERLRIQARVCRDGKWQIIVAAELVPGDLIHVRVGDIVPADLHLTEGNVLVDQSALTGESMPVECAAEGTLYSASIIRRGEASGEVVATGAKSYFGKTAELVRSAGAKSHLEELVLSIVRYLVAMDVLLVVAILAYAMVENISLARILPFALILLVASVPVALPATFTLATAIASLHLVHRGVLVTRLAAVEEAAAMNDLCSDKTGTLTQNRLSLSQTQPWPEVEENDLLAMASVASDNSTQDPIDLAILQEATKRQIKLPVRQQFVPFDPASKRSEGVFQQEGSAWRALKGSPQIIAKLCAIADWENVTAQLADTGARVLAVAAGPEGNPRFLGLLALADPIRPDAGEVVHHLQELGVHVRMVTGDSAQTAQYVAGTLGIVGQTCDRSRLSEDCGVYAGVFPADKFHLVQGLQKKGRIVGMTGDGVNDAPALKQAEMGVAVETATDVAKAAASIVLTTPGLQGVLDAVTTGRRVYQRMLTYTLNKIVKVFQVALFLSLGFLIFRSFVVTPLLVLLLLFANDFVTMSLAEDNVRPSPQPDRWAIRTLILSSLVVSIAWLVYIFGVYAVGRTLHLPTDSLQTLDFLGLVFSGLANVFLVRERGHIWAGRPGAFLAVASLADVIVVSILAIMGWLMAPIPVLFVAYLLGATVLYTLLLDQIKVPLLRRLTSA
ncbi:plasma-membrane proton-efflux P-type ATPase [Acidithiobacillus sp. CV18-2]|nr:plasma-membrane proton-efflux P-type ATPase [Acidithiobacillus sp. CV18-3]MBU2758155.1 plasma-membrane proton-efflux P-type ATPase [Acidithiobacillus sp. BN09-2]MBU2776399.1 plasma-membrane proton-efflux P-type ATPase [Acidithiobacillus sp. CV18-2]MBU2798562.1 plasma-membrane proton-efflux P-type ATPase [Acidithiobacillus sp. VAN18-4]UTV82108.1 plasma-membrane proton-efflux P-type ATPase [Acidithiobacillus sp. YTS05]